MPIKVFNPVRLYSHLSGFRSGCKLGRAAGQVLPLQTKQLPNFLLLS